MKRFQTLFLIFIFLMPLLQGLYFLQQMYFVMVGALILLAFSYYRQKGFMVQSSGTLIFLITLAILYGAAVIYAVDRGMAFLGFLKYLVYIGLFLFYTQLNEEGFKTKVLHCFAIGLALTAFISLFAFMIPPLGDLWIQNNRLGGPLQYANAYGLLLVIACIILLSLESRYFIRELGILILMTALILTMSRSMIYLGAIVILFMIVITKSRRLRNLLSVTSGFGIGYGLTRFLHLEEIHRLSDVSTKTSEMATRLLYYDDAITMIREYPFGTGYLGYYSIERTYQTGSTYFVKFVHSHFFQTFLDIGFIGVLLFILFLVWVWIGSKNTFKDKLIFSIILGHALIDFDLEFGGIFFLWILLSTSSMPAERRRVRSPILITILLLFIPIFIFFGIVTETDNHHLYPYYTQAMVDELKTTSNLSEEEKFELSARILKQNAYQVEAYRFQRDYYHAKKMYKQAIYAAQMCMKTNPLGLTEVEKYSDILLEWGQERFIQEDYTGAKTCIEEIGKIPMYLEELAKNRISHYNVKHIPDLTMSSHLKSNEQLSKSMQEAIYKYTDE